MEKVMRKFVSSFICLFLFIPYYAQTADANNNNTKRASAYDYEPYQVVSNDLLRQYDPEYEQFSGIEISNKIVYFQQRMLEEAIVQKDRIVYHFDKNTKELLDVKVHWREDLPDELPPIISREQAEAMVEAPVRYSRLYYIAEDSRVFPIKPTPKNPCWVIETLNDSDTTVTIIDAVEGELAGFGVPPPSQYAAFSLTGYMYEHPNDCSANFGWYPWYLNARDWFDTMNYNTDFIKYPNEAKLRSHIQSHQTAMFYEIAHGGSYGFTASYDSNLCSSPLTSSDEIEQWIANYEKMPFTFLASCGGMCYTDDDTLSYEFRKGSNTDTATVGYCDMSVLPCVEDCWYGDGTLEWQDALFNYMNQGWTVKDAFDQANADYPGCGANGCMRFAGDESFAVIPVIRRDCFRFVDISAAPDGNGLSWAAAYNDLQNALDDPASEIWVAAGTYTPDRDTGDRSASFRLPTNVAIYGGFPPGGGAWEDRNPAVYETALSGDLNGDDGPGFANNGENSYHVVFTYQASATNLDGFTITAGNANDPTFGYGGGICLRSSNDFCLSNCIIAGNAALSNGGGLYCENTISKFINCQINNNSADKGGGIAFNDRRNTGKIIFRNCTITKNEASSQAGGILSMVSKGNVEVINSILWDNLPEQILDNLGTLSVAYSDVQSGWTGLGNITADPCFVDQGNGDFHLKSQAGRWEHSSQSWVNDTVTSLCIDTGSPGSSLGAEPNDANNLRVNMGAYGQTAQASKSPRGWGLLADLTNDGLVNSIDYAHQAVDWLVSDNEMPGDLDRNDIVDGNDLAPFVDDWLLETTWHEP